MTLITVQKRVMVMYRMKVGRRRGLGLQFIFAVNMKYAGCWIFKTFKDITYIVYIHWWKNNWPKEINCSVLKVLDIRHEDRLAGKLGVTGTMVWDWSTWLWRCHTHSWMGERMPVQFLKVKGTLFGMNTKSNPWYLYQSIAVYPINQYCYFVSVGKHPDDTLLLACGKELWSAFRLVFLWGTLKTEGNPSDKGVLEASILERSILAGEREARVSQALCPQLLVQRSICQAQVTWIRLHSSVSAIAFLRGLLLGSVACQRWGRVSY